jgi:hypothetical protein
MFAIIYWELIGFCFFILGESNFCAPHTFKNSPFCILLIVTFTLMYMAPHAQKQKKEKKIIVAWNPGEFLN